MSRGSPRLVCVVEGHGEVEAIPVLCGRVLGRLGVTGWAIDKFPVRQPRSRLVEETVASPRRPCRTDGMSRALAMAHARPATAVLVVCDSDDDCAASWGTSADAMPTQVVPFKAVMAVREYEAWLLWSRSDIELLRAHATNPDIVRDAKGALRRLVPGYMPTVHQLAETRRLDIDRVWARSDSFDKLVRALAQITGHSPPARPSQK